MKDLFFFGTLCDPALRAVVLGRRDVVAEPAVLPGFQRCAVQGESFPVLVPSAQAAVEGVVCLGLEAEDLARLSYYEGGFGYGPQALPVQHQGQTRDALVYLAARGTWQAEGPWDLAHWQKKCGPAQCRAAKDIMVGYTPDADPVPDWRRVVLGQRAQARVAASRDPSPCIPGTPQISDIKNVKITSDYDRFFKVDDAVLTPPRFDGQPSSEVLRSVFISADAVTVLPYDPVNDRVLLVEQFRTAPYLREDPNPWILEPVAGRVDLGETYPEAARREMLEESGLTPDRLIEIGRYYSSPGTLMEFMASFIAVMPLPEPGTWLGGLASEDEDIRAHVFDYEQFCQLQTKGHFRNGPLLISAGWLALNRSALQEGAL